MLTPELIKHELGESPDLSTKDGAMRWVFYLIHAYHSGFLKKKRLNQLVAIAKAAVFAKPQLPGVSSDYLNFGFYNTESPLHLCKATWIGTFSRKTSRHTECYECGFCVCGCGKTRKQFLDEINAKELDLLWETLQEAHQLNDNESTICRNYTQKCKHGRWNNLDCNCDLKSILAMFKLRHVKFRIHKRHWKQLWELTKAAQTRYSFTDQQLKQLRRHLLLCDRLGQYTYTGHIQLCLHHPKEIIELMSNSPT